MDLTSAKLGNTEKAKNELVTKVLIHLDQIDFNLSDSNADVLGDAYEYLIEQLNCLDAVIGLPANIFYGTSIPTCVLVFKKCRKNPDDILFIDASQHFEKVKTQNKLLPEHIDKIVTAYATRSNEPKYSHVGALADIKASATT